MSITLDTGALIALERDDRDAWAFLRRSINREEPPTVPTVVLVQAWRGRPRQARLARALEDCASESLGQEVARHAGELCGRARTSDVVDAVVVISAARRNDLILTSDPDDLEHLADQVDGGVTIVAL